MAPSAVENQHRVAKTEEGCSERLGPSKKHSVVEEIQYF